jgi:signal-transduction protein with cAMP-binding, CBS, and nucleotidyltransferase domain
MVTFAQLCALRHGVTATNTADRMTRLRDMGALTQSTHAETFVALQILLSLCLRNEAETSATGQTPTNQVNLKSLTEIEETTLKQVFARVVALQRKVSFDLLGGASRGTTWRVT